jgi:two-component system sensor histidine kinase/response regulator
MYRPGLQTQLPERENWRMEGMQQPVGDEAKPQSQQDVLRAGLLQRIRDLGLETDPTFVIELIESYSPLFKDLSRAIEEACTKRDESKLQYAAHSLKGASLNIGAADLGAICKSIEEFANKSDIDSAQNLVPALQEAMKGTTSALATIKAKLSKGIQSGSGTNSRG